MGRKTRGFPSGSDCKESACNSGDTGFNPRVRKIPWRRDWQPTPVFLPGEFHGQRSLVGYSSWGHKEVDTTEQVTHTENMKRDFIKEGTQMAKKHTKTCPTSLAFRPHQVSLQTYTNG